MQNRKWCIGGMTCSLLFIMALQATPLHAQSNPPIKRVRVLSGFGCEGSLADFGRRLVELGWVEGKTLITDCVSTTRLEELTTRSADLVSRRADVLVSSPTLYVRVLKRMSADIPIVMISTPDPVEHELVTNLPGRKET